MRESSTVACNEARSSRSTTHVNELFQALQRLDQRLERAMLSAQATYGTAVATDPYRGLYISHQKVERLLAREPGAPVLRPEPSADKTVRMRQFVDAAHKSRSCVYAMGGNIAWGVNHQWVISSIN
jgi:hypothetical protein